MLTISTSICIMVVQTSCHSLINLGLSIGPFPWCICSGQAVASPPPRGGWSQPSHTSGTPSYPGRREHARRGCKWQANWSGLVLLCWACWSPRHRAGTVGDTWQALALVGRGLRGYRLPWRDAGPGAAAFRAWLALRRPSPFPTASLCTAVPLEIAVAMVFPKKTHLFPPFPTTTTPHRLNLVTAVMTRLPEKGHFT